MITLLTRIVERLTSGRFILTVIAGSTFYYAVKHDILNGETVSAILVMVFINYFQKDRQSQNGGTQ